MSGHTRTRLDGLQVLRFVAAFMILGGHLVQEGVAFGFLPATMLGPLAYLPWFAGVDIFFVISGFIMFHVSSDAFGKPGAQRRFLSRRFVRLVPLYWFFSAAMLAAIFVLPSRIDNGALDLGHIAASFAFIPWLNAKDVVQPILALGWTLNYEMFFYVMFSFALILPKRMGMLALVGLFAGLALVHPFIDAGSMQLKFWSNPIILEFLGGIGAAYWVSRARGLSGMGAWGLFLCGLGGLMFAPFWGLEGDYARVVSYGIPAILIVAGVAASGFGVKSRTGRGMILAGDASYALYLSHPFSVNLVALGLGLMGPTMGWLFLPTALILAIGVSIGVYLILERPLTRRLNAKLTSASKSPAPTPQTSKRAEPHHGR